MSSSSKGTSRVSREKGTIIIIGSPNVGKSVLFNRLAGRYATVSNYPGTTIECDHGKIKIGPKHYRLIDTPGTYSLLPISEEEQITRKFLIEQKPDVVINVVDAKNLPRMLILTTQLLEAGLPVILVLNMMDEAEKLGIQINTRLLERRLGIPVIPMVAVTGEGLGELKRHINESQIQSDFTIDYPARIGTSLDRIANHLGEDHSFSNRFLALLLIQRDKHFKDFGIPLSASLLTELKKVRQSFGGAFSMFISQTRKATIDEIISAVFRKNIVVPNRFHRFLDHISLHPVWGTFLLIAILYFGLYKFVGGFGAGTLVDFMENNIFGQLINPFVIDFFHSIFPFPHQHLAEGGVITTNYLLAGDLALGQKVMLALHDLFVGEYGIFTLGFSYALAIVFPLVTLYFLFFSLLEDSGYLPRLAAMLDMLLKKIGLNGRAVIPLVLGLGCGTMATLTTRILETRRERLIAIFLLALTIPCSAQLGIIMSVLASDGRALLFWATTMVVIFGVSGILLNHILPGQKQSFYLEIPPLRLPKLSNILVKTYTRLKLYLLEIVPIFIYASILIWLGKLIKIFDVLISFLTIIVRFIGLPTETSRIFLFGFFRRDYGAAGLYDIYQDGTLSLRDLIVSSIILTLFIPCIAQFLIMKKEVGGKVAFLMSGLILITAFVIGYLVNVLLMAIGVC